MLVLLTGVAGFIGSKVAELLLAEGHQVVGVDNLNDAYDPRLKQHRLDGLLGREGFDFARVDIVDRDALDRICSGYRPFDAVINLAARAGVRPSVEDPWVYVDTNITGTLNLLELCRWTGCDKFVLASTSSLYGASNPQPFTEDQDTSRPLSPYAASKKGAEALCYTYHYLHDIDVTVFRYFTVYGPAGRPDMSLFRFCRWIAEGEPVEIFGDGHQSRDFTYVDDIVAANLAAATRDAPSGSVINIAGGSSVSLAEVIALIEEIAGEPIPVEQHPVQAGDVTRTGGSTERARSLLGWSPQVGLRDGLERQLEWHRTHRDAPPVGERRS